MRALVLAGLTHATGVIFAVLLALTLSSDPAWALPNVGDRRPNISVQDAWDRPIHLDALGAQPTLVVYEDRGSVRENIDLKNELAALARGGRYQGKIALIAVADVGAYDFWPIRSFVVRAIKDESRKAGTPIYCDWDGHFRRALALERGRSNVVLYGKDGRAVMSFVGPMPKDARDQLIATLRAAADR